MMAHQKCLEKYFKANKFSGFQKVIHFIFQKERRGGTGKCLTWLDRKWNPLIGLGLATSSRIPKVKNKHVA